MAQGQMGTGSEPACVNLSDSESRAARKHEPIPDVDGARDRPHVIGRAGVCPRRRRGRGAVAPDPCGPVQRRSSRPVRHNLRRPERDRRQPARRRRTVLQRGRLGPSHRDRQRRGRTHLERPRNDARRADLYTSPDALGESDLHATWVGLVLGGFNPNADRNEYPYHQLGMAPFTRLCSGAIATGWYNALDPDTGGQNVYFDITPKTFYLAYNHYFTTTWTRTLDFGFFSMDFDAPTDVINSSWGYDDPRGTDPFTMASDGFARAHPQTAFVVAAGNSNTPSHPSNNVGGPASAYNTIAVGAGGLQLRQLHDGRRFQQPWTARLLQSGRPHGARRPGRRGSRGTGHVALVGVLRRPDRRQPHLIGGQPARSVRRRAGLVLVETCRHQLLRADRRRGRILAEDRLLHPLAGTGIARYASHQGRPPELGHEVAGLGQRPARQPGRGRRDDAIARLGPGSGDARSRPRLHSVSLRNVRSQSRGNGRRAGDRRRNHLDPRLGLRLDRHGPQPAEHLPQRLPDQPKACRRHGHGRHACLVPQSRRPRVHRQCGPQPAVAHDERPGFRQPGPGDMERPASRGATRPR